MHAAYALRDHDVAQRLRVREPERPGGRALARVHRLHAGAQDLRDVRRVGQDQRDRAPERRADRQALQLQGRDAEAAASRTTSRGRPRKRSTYTVAAARIGKNTGPRRVRAIASSIAKIRMKTSQTTMIRMLSHRPLAMSGSTCQP